MVYKVSRLLKHPRLRITILDVVNCEPSPIGSVLSDE